MMVARGYIRFLLWLFGISLRLSQFCDRGGYHVLQVGIPEINIKCYVGRIDEFFKLVI